MELLVFGVFANSIDPESGRIQTLLHHVLGLVVLGSSVSQRMLHTTFTQKMDPMISRIAFT